MKAGMRYIEESPRSESWEVRESSMVVEFSWLTGNVSIPELPL